VATGGHAHHMSVLFTPPGFRGNVVPAGTRVHAPGSLGEATVRLVMLRE
jgi:hypothetical protein